MRTTTITITLAIPFILGAAALYGQRTNAPHQRQVPWKGTTQRVVMPRMPSGLDVVPRDPTNSVAPGPLTLTSTSTSTAAAETQSAFQRGFGEGAIRASILARRNPDVAPQLVVQMAWAAWGVEQQQGAAKGGAK